MRVTSREQMYTALFDFWSVDPNNIIKTKGRRLRVWNEVPYGEQPAVFQTQGFERPIGTKVIGIMLAWECVVELVVYTNSGEDMTVAPASLLNPVLDYLEQLFPVSGIPQTLGGLVKEVRIAPQGIKTDEGALGSQAVALVPLRIVTL